MEDPGDAAPSAARRSLLEIHAAVFLFGFPGLFAKWLPLPPQAIVLGRVVFASLALFGVLVVSRRPLGVRPSRDLTLLALCGLILAVHWTLFFKSIQVSSVAVGLLAYSSFPVFTVLLEPLVFRERLELRSLVWAGLCLFGVFLIVPRFSVSDAIFRGVAWGLGAGLTFACLTLLNRGLSRRHASLSVAFYQDSFATLFLLPFAAVPLAGLSVRGLGLLVLLGAFGTAAAHTLFIGGMRHVPARTASIISALEPVYGILLALAFLGEVPTLRTVCGGAVVLAAALAVTVDARRLT